MSSGERAWVERLRARLQTDAEFVALGIGDDAAIVRFDADVVVSVDEQREGAHFRRGWLSLSQLGLRSCAVSLSDLVAMGAAPRAMLLSITWPSAEPWQEGMQIIEGAADAAARYGAPIVGGNLTRGDSLGVGVTVLGTAPERPLLRSGASVGEHLFVTGPLGGAAVGWRSLERGASKNARCIERWRAPAPRFDCLEMLREHACSAIDVSDGLRSDAAAIADESGVRVVIDAHAIPLLEGAEQAAARIGESARELAFTGGEDYEVLFTARAEAIEGAVRIGAIAEGRGVEVRGLELGSSDGHDHFS